MLMLAVTVMIAAIVSAFAGGFSDSGEKSPQSSIRVTPNLDQNHHNLSFEHNGGDPFTLSSIKIVLRAGDNSTTLSTSDIGGKVNAFEEVGGGKDTTIKAGDIFVIEGYPSGASTRFGSMILPDNARITWLVVDKETSKTISMGSFFL
jgi:archaeal type IV pilus assembly protein PilA